MSFWNFVKTTFVDDFVQSLNSFFKGSEEDHSKEIEVYDVNPVLTDRSEIDDIAMNQGLADHIIKAWDQNIEAANENHIFLANSPLEDDTSLDALVPGFEDDFESQINLDALENPLDFSESSFDNLTAANESLHLHVNVDDVMDLGNNLIIPEEEVHFLSFQDEGWHKVEDTEEEMSLSEEAELLPGYDIYVHDSGAILQVDQNIEITPPEM